MAAISDDHVWLTGSVVKALSVSLDQLKTRAKWYADGCPGLDDSEAYRREDMARDAADDLSDALRLVETLKGDHDRLVRLVRGLTTNGDISKAQGIIEEARACLEAQEK